MTSFNKIYFDQKIVGTNQKTSLQDDDFDQLCLIFEQNRKLATIHGRELRHIGQVVLPYLSRKIKNQIDQYQLTFDF